MNKKNNYSTYTLVTMALFAALLCVSAYISIPIPGGSHITMQNFMILMIALLFPLGQSLSIVSVWMLLGCVGIPVFIAGNAGIGYLIGGYGGYTFSFLLISLLIPLLRGKTYHRIRYIIVAIFASLLVDTVGFFWLMLLTKIPLKAAFLGGFLPYLPLDLVKSVVAAFLVPAFRKIIAESNEH